MLSNCRDAMDNSPIIAAIKDMTGLEKCLTCDSQVIFYSVWRYLQYFRYCRQSEICRKNRYGTH